MIIRDRSSWAARVLLTSLYQSELHALAGTICWLPDNSAASSFVLLIHSLSDNQQRPAKQSTSRQVVPVACHNDMQKVDLEPRPVINHMAAVPVAKDGAETHVNTNDNLVYNILIDINTRVCRGRQSPYPELRASIVQSSDVNTGLIEMEI